MAQSFHRSFDYIVVGGSPASLILAARLAQDSKTTVCLLEPSDSASVQLADASLTTNSQHNPEYDILELLGAKGWNWASLSGYYNQLLSRNTNISTQEVTLETHIRAAFKNASVPYTVMTTSKVKVPPVETTGNLEVITGAHVTRLVAKVIAEDGDPWNALELDPNAPTLVVHGVEYLKEGKLLVAPPRKEVLLCAGAERNTQILQLSGIGDPSHLKSLEVSDVLNLPGVGKNYLELHEPIENGSLPSFFIDSIALALDINTLSAPKTQKRWLVESKTPLLEYARPSYLCRQSRSSQDLSGTVQKLPLIESQAHPPVFSRIRILTHEADLAILVAAIKICRQLFATGDFSTLVSKEVTPGVQAQSDEELKEYIKRNVAIASKPVGTTPMVSRNDAGVVASNLKIYGAENLRVVDESVLPLQFSASPLGLAIIIAKRFVDTIKEHTSVL